jgi:hypothetical protein
MEKKKPKRRSVEVHLEDHELRKLKIMAAELGSHTVTITTELIRAGFKPENREYVEELVREAEARSRG